MHFENVIILYPILLFSIIIHEVAHGWMAERFGDDTARVMGRLTFNPIPHIDIVGTVILPILGLLYPGGFLFGWAKPVPVNPYRLNDPKRDMMWVGLAGPASNIILALFAAAFMWALRNYNFLPQTIGSAVYTLASVLLQLNVVLFIFNLFPVPPLDGSRIVAAILPPPLAYRYAQLEQYGFIIVLVLFATGVMSMILGPVVMFFVNLLTGVNAGI